MSWEAWASELEEDEAVDIVVDFVVDVVAGFVEDVADVFGAIAKAICFVIESQSFFRNVSGQGLFTGKIPTCPVEASTSVRLLFYTDTPIWVNSQTLLPSTPIEDIFSLTKYDCYIIPWC